VLANHQVQRDPLRQQLQSEQPTFVPSKYFTFSAGPDFPGLMA
jgi:hypothetical protein